MAKYLKLALSEKIILKRSRQETGDFWEESTQIRKTRKLNLILPLPKRRKSAKTNFLVTCCLSCTEPRNLFCDFSFFLTWMLWRRNEESLFQVQKPSFKLILKCSQGHLTGRFQNLNSFCIPINFTYAMHSVYNSSNNKSSLSAIKYIVFQNSVCLLATLPWVWHDQDNCNLGGILNSKFQLPEFHP